MSHPTPRSYQSRVWAWLVLCLGTERAQELRERLIRFIEEALELVQSLGLSRDDVLALVEYVYGRPAGDPPQEVGGVAVTLAGLCQAHGLDMDECAEKELARVLSPGVIEKVRLKQAEKDVALAGLLEGGG